MTGEYLFSQPTDQVDEAYFDRLQTPLYGHAKSPLEQRIDEADLSDDEQRILRAISAEYVLALATLPPEVQAKKRTALLETLSRPLSRYDDNRLAGLSRDIENGEVSIVLGGQPLDPEELEAMYEAIPPSHEELNIREAEAKIGTDGLLDRTHTDPKDPMYYLVNAEELPAFVYDVAHPGEGIVEWHEDDCLELTDPEDLHTGLSRGLGRIGLRLVDTGKLVIQKIAS